MREGAASRASRKPCRRASLLHRAPNERSRVVDARALGRECFLEKWPSGDFCCRVHREVILKVRRTIFSHDFTMHAAASHSSFVTWIKVVFWDGRRLAHLLGGQVVRRTAPATWSTPHWGAYSVPRNHPTPAPDSPARQQAAEVKMIGYITISSGIAPRLSENWRHVACTYVAITVCTSAFCDGVAVVARSRRRASARASLDYA